MTAKRDKPVLNLTTQRAICKCCRNFTMIEIVRLDFFEHFAPWIKDILIQNFSNFSKHGFQWFRDGFQHKKYYLIEVLTEEWGIIINPLEIVWYAEEIDSLKYKVLQLEERLQKLETK